MLIFLAVALQSASPSPPPPPPPHGGPEQMTCPVGGEPFEALVSTHYSTYGSRPDGRPNSYWFMPLPLPVCPSNGLVVFRHFTPEQVETLAQLIATQEYRTMITRDSTYYRAQWLATRIGRSEREALWLLLSATWQVKRETGPTGQAMPSAALARRYQEEFVRRVRALPSDPANSDFRSLYARAANAERELGRFRQAAAMLRELQTWLGPGSAAATVASRAGRAETHFRSFVEKLLVVVARGDRSIEPLDMAEEVRVPWLCMSETLETTPLNREVCSRPEVQTAIAENLRRREEMRQRYERAREKLASPPQGDSAPQPDH